MCELNCLEKFKNQQCGKMHVILVFQFAFTEFVCEQTNRVVFSLMCPLINAVSMNYFFQLIEMLSYVCDKIM